MVEHLAVNQGVRGSSPRPGANEKTNMETDISTASLAQLAERALDKRGVGGSNPSGGTNTGEEE